MSHGTNTGRTPRLPENPIIAAPATPKACASDYRTPAEQKKAAAAARDQLAFARMTGRR
ncbi:hypothetical protein [Streptomyces sp. YIM S03343]